MQVVAVVKIPRDLYLIYRIIDDRSGRCSVVCRIVESNGIIVELFLSTYALMVQHGTVYLEHICIFHRRE